MQFNFIHQSQFCSEKLPFLLMETSPLWSDLWRGCTASSHIKMKGRGRSWLQRFTLYMLKSNTAAAAGVLSERVVLQGYIKKTQKILSQMSWNLLERWIMVGGKSKEILVWIQISFPKVSKQEIDFGLMFVKWQNYLFMCLLEVKLYSGVLWLFKNSQRKKPLMFKSRSLELGWETFLMLFLQRFNVNVIFGLLSTFINPEFSNLMCSTSAVVWMTGWTEELHKGPV